MTDQTPDPRTIVLDMLSARLADVRADVGEVASPLDHLPASEQHAAIDSVEALLRAAATDGDDPSLGADYLSRVTQPRELTPEDQSQVRDLLDRDTTDTDADVDHSDAPNGYAHIEVYVERHPTLDVEALADEISDVVHRACDRATDGEDGCIEHDEAMTTVACRFYQDGDNTTHTATS